MAHDVTLSPLQTPHLPVSDNTSPEPEARPSCCSRVGNAVLRALYFIGRCFMLLFSCLTAPFSWLKSCCVRRTEQHASEAGAAMDAAVEEAMESDRIELIQKINQKYTFNPYLGPQQIDPPPAYTPPSIT